MSLDVGMVETFYTEEEDDNWSVIGVIKADDGYYVGTDCGCSCNSPWDYYEDASDFVGPMSFEDMCAEVRSIAGMYQGVDRTELDEYLESLE